MMDFERARKKADLMEKSTELQSGLKSVTPTGMPTELQLDHP